MNYFNHVTTSDPTRMHFKVSVIGEIFQLYALIESDDDTGNSMITINRSQIPVVVSIWPNITWRGIQGSDKGALQLILLKLPMHPSNFSKRKMWKCCSVSKKRSWNLIFSKDKSIVSYRMVTFLRHGWQHVRMVE